QRGALLAVLLLAVSPHFLLTHATLLSQTTSCLCTLLAVHASLLHAETGRVRWLWWMGVTLGFGVLTRPLPMLLVAAVVGVDKLAEPFVTHSPRASRLAARQALHWLAPLGSFAGLFLLTNYLQSGNPWTSGYHELHGSFGMFQNIDGELTNSLGGALVRENAWLFGWPCSLLFVPFARGRVRTKALLFWAVVGTGVVYRALVPKTVVATTGPVYVTELVPWLCIASVAGLQQVAALLQRVHVADAPARLASLAAAGCIVAAAAFAPVQARELQRSAFPRDDVANSVREQAKGKAVVFCEGLVGPNSGLSWAYYAPNPWPDLRDDVLYLRIPRGPDGARRLFQLWRTQLTDRAAFVFVPNQQAGDLRKLSPEQVDAQLARGSRH
ncbi:MAG: glycosyltransferase family 39 protein, partial [Polyangiales bacterium]